MCALNPPELKDDQMQTGITDESGEKTVLNKTAHHATVFPIWDIDKEVLLCFRAGDLKRIQSLFKAWVFYRDNSCTIDGLQAKMLQLSESLADLSPEGRSVYCRQAMHLLTEMQGCVLVYTHMKEQPPVWFLELVEIGLKLLYGEPREYFLKEVLAQLKVR